jgi:hypothetical protein
LNSQHSRSLRQEFEAILGYIVRPYFKKKCVVNCSKELWV